MINKIKSQSEAYYILENLKSYGKKIVFTNGCFDILHVGHLRYLAECKKAGDVLVIGLNTDNSVKLNKGDLRPIVPFEERAELLAGLEVVDFVVPFDEKTPQNIISYLKPDVLIKGADYSIDTIVGAKEVMENGGTVYTVELIEGKSTRNIIQTILDRYKN